MVIAIDYDHWNIRILTQTHEQTLTNMFPVSGLMTYMNFPDMKISVATIIKTAGTPKANG
jgi:hypothetical protein